ncbi:MULTISPECIES: hypothetical protein [Mycobacteriaceae]|uniref:Uncharacterized protein n=1 Tax=Mycolicibacterium fluoranthenivorans TaxID=258505 RepID=A0A7X5TWM3_9MYCO|nr:MULTISPECIES: hypothetical protein [Mycobacteriaceae]MCV7252570.1 hypothetical protein [Mycobacterium hackensackense]MCV7356720.1 hypothetical protein [Mycolicibacterium fluoranthenivorans]NIH94112.1 hypothetical protein [Mycolicibacterium fluoranthenivorans]
MRERVVAAIGGLVIGHVLWLLAITAAINTSDVSFWVLIVSVVIIGLSAGVALLGWRSYQRKQQVRTAFLWALPIAPVLMTIAVLGVTYL